MCIYIYMYRRYKRCHDAIHDMIRYDAMRYDAMAMLAVLALVKEDPGGECVSRLRLKSPRFRPETLCCISGPSSRSEPPTWHRWEPSWYPRDKCFLLRHLGIAEQL